MLTQTLQYLGIGFISSAILILLSSIMQSVIRRPADYYSAEETWPEPRFTGSAWISRAVSEKKEDLDEIRRMLEQAYAAQTQSEQQTDQQEQPDKAGTEINDIPETTMYPEPETVTSDAAETVTLAEPETVTSDATETLKEAESVNVTPDTRSRKRKPSMKMKKAELIEIAEGMGIEIPEKATKQIILDLIREQQ